MLKKIFIRFFAPLISVILLAGVLSGCSGQGKIKLDPDNPVNIVVWHYYHGAQKTAFDRAISEFNDTLGYENGIIVDAVSYGGVDELADYVLSAARGDLDAGSMPEIFGSYGDTALEIVNMGMAAAIDDYISEEELAEYEESFIREGRIVADKLYVFPIAKSTESLMLNKTDFDVFAAELASSGTKISYDDLATWEGLARVAELYREYTGKLNPDGEGKAFFGIDSVANYLIVGAKQLGQDIVKVEDATAVVDPDPKVMARLWDMYHSVTVTGSATKLGRFCSDDIKTGDSLCYIGSTSSASYFPMELSLEDGSTRNIEMLALPMPVFEGGDKIAISQGAGMVVSKSTPEKEYASTIFLKWFTVAERNISFALNSSYLPVKKDALNEELLNPVFEMVGDGDQGAQNTVKALRVGVVQLKEYELYSSSVFKDGAALRAMLPKALEETALNDRNIYLDMLQSGASPEQAYSDIHSQSRDKFEGWLASLRMSVKGTE